MPARIFRLRTNSLGRAEFYNVDGTSVDYFANVPSGSQVQVVVIDSSEQETYSELVSITPSTIVSADFGCKFFVRPSLWLIANNGRCQATPANGLGPSTLLCSFPR
jgi:hypothetical protein